MLSFRIREVRKREIGKNGKFQILLGNFWVKHFLQVLKLFTPENFPYEKLFNAKILNTKRFLV